jgi:hypothetical protein
MRNQLWKNRETLVKDHARICEQYVDDFVLWGEKIATKSYNSEMFIWQMMMIDNERAIADAVEASHKVFEAVQSNIEKAGC